MPAPSTCVIFNPKAGRGRAPKLVDGTRRWAAPDAVVRATEVPGHAIFLAKQAAEEGFGRIIAAGGDGTIHEVANGLMLANRPDVVLGVWPLGSANDYAFSLGLTPWWKSQGKGVQLEAKRLDIGWVTGAGRELFFANCCGFGFNGLVALESRRIRWLRGIPLYALAFLRVVAWQYRTPMLKLTIDGIEVTKPTLALTVNLGKREGGFPITLQAKLDDGRFDCIHVTDVSRWELVKYLPGIMFGKVPADHPKIHQPTASKVELEADEPMCLHCDGEFFCKPADDIRRATIEVLPKRLLVECCIP